jgi:hypothetical protein
VQIGGYEMIQSSYFGIISLLVTHERYFASIKFQEKRRKLANQINSNTINWIQFCFQF